MEKNPQDVVDIISTGEMEVKGEFVWGSNYTFLAEVTHTKGNLPVVYKPSRGERA